MESTMTSYVNPHSLELQRRSFFNPNTAISNFQKKLEIAIISRYFEILGFGISFIALVMSLIIFAHFPSLRNNRTNIHFNLFFTMTIQVFLRLILYIDQMIIQYIPSLNFRGVNETPIFCQVVFILLEYTISSTFMWMYVEGLFLHGKVTMRRWGDWTAPTLFVCIGWLMPVLWTAMWAIATGVHYENDEGCWHGYTYIQEYWILQGPRLLIIVVNFIFLLNIMRIIVLKLNMTENNEITKIKKAVRAALLLIPLLGITNIFNMVDPVEEAVWKFALWRYVNHFLRSYQGFILSLIYCFTNGEVITVVTKMYRDWKAERDDIMRYCRDCRESRCTRHNCCWKAALFLLPCQSPLRFQRRRSPNNLITNNPVNELLEMMTIDMPGPRDRPCSDFQTRMEEIRVEENMPYTSRIWHTNVGPNSEVVQISNPQPSNLILHKNVMVKLEINDANDKQKLLGYEAIQATEGIPNLGLDEDSLENITERDENNSINKTAGEDEGAIINIEDTDKTVEDLTPTVAETNKATNTKTDENARKNDVENETNTKGLFLKKMTTEILI